MASLLEIPQTWYPLYEYNKKATCRRDLREYPEVTDEQKREIWHWKIVARLTWSFLKSEFGFAKLVEFCHSIYNAYVEESTTPGHGSPEIYDDRPRLLAEDILERLEKNPPAFVLRSSKRRSGDFWCMPEDIERMEREELDSNHVLSITKYTSYWDTSSTFGTAFCVSNMIHEFGHYGLRTFDLNKFWPQRQRQWYEPIELTCLSQTKPAQEGDGEAGSFFENICFSGQVDWNLGAEDEILWKPCVLVDGHTYFRIDEAWLLDFENGSTFSNAVI